MENSKGEGNSVVLCKRVVSDEIMLKDILGKRNRSNPDDNFCGCSTCTQATKRSKISEDRKSLLLSDDKLKEKFDGKFDFKTAASVEENRTFMRQFLEYTMKRFLLGNDAIDKIMKLADEGKSDYVIYKAMQEFQSRYVSFEDEKEKEEKLTSTEKHQYKKTIYTKMRQLKNLLNDHGYNVNRNHELVKSVLDIGTEKLEFLDFIYDALNLNKNKGLVNGINIQQGFCHYEADTFKKNEKDTRFQFYDGLNIPFKDNSIDLITMYSVIHHIPCDDFAKLAHEIARVSNGLLFIKDVDISTSLEDIFFRVQHYVYEGILCPGGTSYLNNEVSMDKTLGALETAGFEVVTKNKRETFNGTYFALLRKKDSTFPKPKARKYNRFRGRGNHYRGKYRGNNNGYNNYRDHHYRGKTRGNNYGDNHYRGNNYKDNHYISNYYGDNQYGDNNYRDNNYGDNNYRDNNYGNYRDNNYGNNNYRDNY